MLRTLLAALVAVLIAPVAWAQSSYTIQPGDLLQFEVLEDPSLNRSLLVLPDGSVSIPLAGSINAAGRSVEAVRGAISGALASNFASPPTVVLSVGQLAAPPPAATPYGTISVYTIGEINTPGRVDIAPGTTLLQFLSQSGGFTPFAATKRIQLRRADTRSGTEQVYNFNYKAIQNGAKAPTIVLRNGDVIIVPERRLFE